MTMRLLRMLYSVALVTVFFDSYAVRAAGVKFADEADLAASTAPFVLDAPTTFEAFSRYSTQALTGAEGRLIVVEIDLENSPGFSLETDGKHREARYRMAFNNIAEGWSWQPLAEPQKEDYYRAKFLPLKSVLVERGAYDFQDKIGETQRMKVTWRYDYFLAFDNLYDFFPRGGDDEAGFVAELPLDNSGQIGDPVRMLAVARVSDPYFSESTTFWKASYGKPTDFTLKKRYLHTVLEMILFCDRQNGRVLGRLIRR